MRTSKYFSFLTKPVAIISWIAIAALACMAGFLFGYLAGLFVASLSAPSNVVVIPAATPELSTPVEVAPTETTKPIIELPKLGSNLKPQDVVDSFMASGLEVGETYPMQPDDYGFAPLGDEGIRFLIPSICDDCGGRIIYYKDLDYLQKAKDYYDNLGKETAALFAWAFVNDHILVQINGELPEDRAREYEKALMEAK